MKSIDERLVEFLKLGQLLPITTIPGLKSQFSAGTILRYATEGRLPAVRVGRRVLTHPSLIEEALPGLITHPGARTTNPGKDKKPAIQTGPKADVSRNRRK